MVNKTILDLPPLGRELDGAEQFETTQDGASEKASAHQLARAPVTPNFQVGTTYTLLPTDDYVVCTNAGAITLTIATHATQAIPVGRVIAVRQGGAGQVTVVAAGGVTLIFPDGPKTAKQNATITLTQESTNVWVVGGYASA